MTAPKPKRRRFQYSLRTLLVVVTLCAIPCSWLGVKIRQAKREREAAAALEKLGAMLYWTGPSGPKWLRSMLGDDLFTRVESANFFGADATDADLANLKTLNQLHELSFDNTRITDAGLEYFEDLTQLQELSLTNSQITDAGLEHLRGLKQLQRLCLDYDINITDAGMEHLKGLSQLQKLSLGCGHRITPAAVKKLQQALPTCEIQY